MTRDNKNNTPAVSFEDNFFPLAEHLELSKLVFEWALSYDANVGSSTFMGWSAVWKTKADKKRLAITVFAALIGQWSGNGIITYYLSLVLNTVNITSSFDQTLINGILQIVNYFAAVLGAILADKLGRRALWLVGLIGMLFTYIIFKACSAVNNETGSPLVGRVVIAFIFLYFIFYDIGVTPLTFAYPAEILPFHTRQKGMAICNFVNGLALMFNTFINPIALDGIGWKYYIVYIILIALMLVVVYLFFAETKGCSLEEISEIFEGRSIVAGRVRRSDLYRRDERDDISADKDADYKAAVHMVEDVTSN